MSKALLVIDLQNDYFPDGNFPLWNADGVLRNALNAVSKAQEDGVPVILIQHIADSSKGKAPFFNPDTDGVDVHPDLLAAAPDAPLIVKHFADGFVGTGLKETLAAFGTTELLVCGMMTQNCVTHTAISKAAEKYAVTVLSDCCTTVTELLHLIALNALTTRITVAPWSSAL